MSGIRNIPGSQEKNPNPSQEDKQIYIYAEVDIDKAYNEIMSKSKKIRAYLQERTLLLDFTEKIRNYKNFRITFDNQIQKFIHHKELTSDLRLIKKNVFNSLEQFIIQRFEMYLEEENLHREYKKKVEDIQKKFSQRFQELMKQAQ